eukprot:1790828-Rhodomonas_salina.1
MSVPIQIQNPVLLRTILVVRKYHIPLTSVLQSSAQRRVHPVGSHQLDNKSLYKTTSPAATSAGPTIVPGYPPVFCSQCHITNTTAVAVPQCPHNLSQFSTNGGAMPVALRRNIFAVHTQKSVPQLQQFGN